MVTEDLSRFRYHTGAPGRRSDEEGRKRAELLQKIFDNAPIGLTVFADDGRLPLVNRAWERMFGWTPQTLAEQQRDTYKEAISDPQMQQRAQQFVAAATREWANFQVRGADGDTFEVMGSAVPLSDGSRLGLVYDVTQRRRAEQELQRTTTLLKAVVDGTTDAVFVKDCGGRYLLCNEAAARFMGRTVSEVLGKEDAAFFDPTSTQVVKDHDQRVMKAGNANTEEEELTVGAITRICLVTKAPYRDDLGNVIGVIGIARDITERKQAAAALQESEDRKTAILRGALDAIITMDHAGDICGWNPAAERIFGYAESEALGRNLANLIIPPALRPRHVAGLANLLATGQASILDQRLELSALRADGSEFPVELSVTRIRDFPQPLFTGFLRDITDRKQSEEARRAAEERLQHVIGSSPAVLFTLQAEDGGFSGINWISSNIEAMLGYPVEEALGADWWLSNIHAEDRDPVVNLFLNEIVTNNYFSAEYRFRHKDGSYRWIRGEIRLLRNEAGQPVEAIGSLSDITQRKQLEDQFRQAQKMEVVGRLAGGMAHDFNNLLAVVLGCCQFLENDAALGDDSRGLVEEIYKATNRAATLTRQLLAFSRQQILQPTLLNLNEVVTEAVSMLDRLIGEDITVKTSLQSRLWPVKVDGGQMNQVIMNLAVNARDAMPQGGTLTIETSNVELDESYAQSHHEVNAGFYVMLVVSDTGIGMDEHTKARIFEPFFTTKETGKGTGLGLATVFGIVNQSEGHVTVDSEVGKGTTFKVYLPRHERVADTSDETKSPVAAPRGTETILVVEDEEMILKLAARILSSQGYTVLQAGNGDEAMRVYRAQAGPIHLLLADVVMPKIGGRQLYDELSAIQPGLKVLFMSGYTDDAVLRHGVLESTTNFIEKPFTYAALATSVRRTLDGK